MSPDLMPFAYLVAGGALVAVGHWCAEANRRRSLRARHERRALPPAEVGDGPSIVADGHITDADVRSFTFPGAPRLRRADLPPIPPALVATPDNPTGKAPDPAA